MMKVLRYFMVLMILLHFSNLLQACEREDISCKHIRDTTEPDLKGMKKSLKKNHGKHYADSAILVTKIEWHTGRKDWPVVRKLFTKKVKKFGVETDSLKYIAFNNTIWLSFFLNNESNEDLGRAIRWMKILIQKEPVQKRWHSLIDTYANLVYKAGRKEEAIAMEMRALEIAKRINASPKWIEVYNATLVKFKTGVKTW